MFVRRPLFQGLIQIEISAAQTTATTSVPEKVVARISLTEDPGDRTGAGDDQPCGCRRRTGRE